ncbi:MAG: hypothetical protein L3J62_01410 [Gammaproteobacteria bacterium]|nr:hypothetical protein [Gammaproteobacteria bacterium]MCF6229443.1 hypothetical protein [Gammaproteobacteria bacterium]
MTSFNIRPDDVGIRNLRNENLKPHATKATTAVDPYPAVNPVKIGFQESALREDIALKGYPDKEKQQAPTAVQEENKHRHNDRRQQQVPVILDTRSGRERRQLSNNTDAVSTHNTDQEGRKTVGIDLYT